jgi:hypothetical protein
MEHAVDDRQRVRRPALERTAPIRNWASVIPGGAAPSGGEVAQGVQNANRVLEEYLRAGESAARLFQRPSRNTGGGDSQDLVQGMVRAASDLTTFWLELFARSSGAPSQSAAAVNPPSATVEPRAASDPVRVTVEVSSGRPVSVTVDLRPEARGATLCAGRLHPRESSAPPLPGVELGTSDSNRGIVVRLRVGPKPPPGTYDGVIVDEQSSLPVGTISVEVQPAATRRTGTNDRRRRSR